MLFWNLITTAQGDGRSLFITGSSIHNSRIEKLWRDVYVLVTSTSSVVFDTLEVVTIFSSLAFLSLSISMANS